MTTLSREELLFAQALGLEGGVDVDSRDPQLFHVCWPYASYQGALCETEHLWAHSGLLDSDTEVTCSTCLGSLDALRHSVSAKLIQVIGTLASHARLLRDLEAAVTDATWVLDNPEEARLHPHATERVGEVQAAQRALLAFHSSQFPAEKLGRRAP